MIDPVIAASNDIDKLQNFARKVSDDKIDMAADLFKLFKNLLIKGSGLTITNNEINDIIKVIKFY